MENLRIVSVTMSLDSANNSVYRVYTSDGTFSQYVGFDSVPDFVIKWMINSGPCRGLLLWGEGGLNGIS